MKQAPHQGGTPSRPRISPAYAWFLVAMLFVAYILSFVDRMILSLLVEPIKADMNLTDTQVSLLQGIAFALFYTLMGLPIGRLVDEGSRVRIIAIGVSVWSLMTGLCGLAQNYWQLFVARMGVGVGEATVSPAAYSIIADSFEERRLGLAMGIYGLGAATGAGLAFLIGGAVIQFVKRAGVITLPFVGELAAWQTGFLLVGLPGVLVGGAFLFMREPPRVGEHSDARPPIDEVMAFLRTKARFLAFHFAAMGLVNMAIFASASWIAVLLMRTHGVSLENSGYIAGGALIFGGLLGSVGGGLASDLLARNGGLTARLRFCAATTAAATLFAIAFPLAGTASGTALFFGLAFMLGGAPVGVAAAALQQATPNRMRGVVSALYLFSINLIGLGFGPTAVALVTDFVFADEQKVRYSLAIVIPIAYVLAAVFFISASRTTRSRALELEAAA